MDPALADLDEIGGPAQAAWRRAADLDVRLFADGLELEHRVEGRDFQHADVGHVKQIGDRADRGFRNPSLMLFLNPPQDRDHRRGLTAFRVFGDLLLSPTPDFPA